jgi:hypothetical protein
VQSKRIDPLGDHVLDHIGREVELEDIHLRSLVGVGLILWPLAEGRDVVGSPS